MRKWGIVISVFYAVIVGFLLVPAFFLIAGGFTDPIWKIFLTGLVSLLQEWLAWILIAAVLVGQALLLFLSVDTTQKKLKPRTHIAISVAVSSMLFGLLTLAVIFCIGIAARGDNFGAGFLDTSANRSDHARHLLAVKGERPGVADRRSLPRLGSAPGRMLRSVLHQLRHRDRNRCDVDVLRSERAVSF
jgi:hypothetical protein